MDRDRFDALAQVIAANRSRRAALATLLGAALLGRVPAAAPAKSKGHGKGKGHGHGKGKGKGNGGADDVIEIPPSCYRNNACTVGPGKHDAKCDFMGSKAFHRADVHGIDLRRANLIGAQLDGADLRGANLSGACLVGANLHGAKIDATTNLDGALFCQTVMPDGSLNDDGCGKGTPCCPAPGIGPEACVDGLGSLCSILGNPCCRPAACVASAHIVITTCQIPCNTVADCARYASQYDLICHQDTVTCPFLSECCLPKPCETHADCPVTGRCCKLPHQSYRQCGGC